MVWRVIRRNRLGSLQTSKAITVTAAWLTICSTATPAAGYFVYTFVPNGQKKTTLPSGSSSVDMMKFFNYLNGKAGFSLNMYLDVVEAGCEISFGGGTISSTGFSCTAN